MRRQCDVVGSELRARDLEDDVGHALSDFGCGAVHLRAAVVVETHPCRGVVVEAFGIADVLEADGEADAALDAFPPRRVPGAARQAQGIARQLLRFRKG